MSVSKGLARVLPVAALGVFCLAHEADAALMLRLSSGSSTITVEDGGAGDIDLQEGVVVYSGPIGSFTVNVSTGVSKPLIGSDVFPALHLNSVDVTGALAGSLTVELSDTGFLTNGPVYFASSIGGTFLKPTDLTYETYLGVDNQLFSTDTLVSSLAFQGSGFFGGGEGAWVDTTSPYSLTQVVSFAQPGSSVTSFDAQIAVAQPATLALLGLGLLGVAAGSRWLRGIAPGSRTES